MVKSFNCKETEKIFNRRYSRKFSAKLQRVVLKKLVMLDAAERIDDLKVPPSNKLEKLRGDRKGQRSIRVNGQWRICFRWKAGHSFDVELVDYH